MPTLPKLAKRAVGRSLRDVEHCARRALPEGRAADLHALRVAVKRLRYNLEFFASLLSGHADEPLDLLERAQDRLGAIADAVTFTRTYDHFLKRFGPDDPRRAGLEAARAAARRRQKRTVESLRKLWLHGDANYPERLAASISSALGSLSPKSEP